MSRSPTLGTAAYYTPQSTVLNVTESTCLQLSLFKDIMREYRKVDDGITMRMNRNGALFRDRTREGRSLSGSEEESCAYFWKELVANWRSRAEILDYCIKVYDSRIGEQEKTMPEKAEQRMVYDRDSRTAVAFFEDQTKRGQIRNEQVVEQIVQQRSFDAFRSRCKLFEPPRSDAEARKWWEAVSRR